MAWCEATGSYIAIIFAWITESLVLAGLGGVLGVGVAIAAVPLLVQLVPVDLPVAQSPTVDLQMLLFARAPRPGTRMLEMLDAAARLEEVVIPAGETGENELMADNMETYRTVTPYLVVPDADAEIRFLKAAFGAIEASCQRNPDHTVMHAELNIGNSLIMLGQAGREWKPLPASLYVWVPDVDATYARALTAGATSQAPPENKPYGHRNAGVVDQNGITWWIGSPVA